jgi:hypothetical protein
MSEPDPVLHRKEDLYRWWAEDVLGYVQALRRLIIPNVNDLETVTRGAMEAATALQHVRLDEFRRRAQVKQMQEDFAAFIQQVTGGTVTTPDQLATALKDFNERQEQRDKENREGGG